MRDPAWLDDLEDPDDPASGTPARRVRPLLMVLAALPWLLVIALFVVPARHGPALPDGGQASGTGAAAATEPLDPFGTPDGEEAGGARMADSEPSGSRSAGDDPQGRAQPGIGLDTGDATPLASGHGPHGDTTSLADSRSIDADPDLAAIALLAARSWLSGADRHDDDVLPSRDETNYAEHLQLEGLDGDGDLLVARVVALLLDVDAAVAPRLQRIAVPLAATSDGPRLLGEPWELPTPALDVAALSTEQLTDPALIDAAALALDGAGFSDPQVQRLARTAGWPLVVTFTTGDRAAERQVWLRAAAGGGLAVAGLDHRAVTVGQTSGADTDRSDDSGARP